jgi:hypothetical protein
MRTSAQIKDDSEKSSETGTTFQVDVPSFELRVFGCQSREFGPEASIYIDLSPPEVLVFHATNPGDKCKRRTVEDSAALEQASSSRDAPLGQRGARGARAPVWSNRELQYGGVWEVDAVVFDLAH